MMRLEDAPLAISTAFPGHPEKRFTLQHYPCLEVVRSMVGVLTKFEGADRDIGSPHTVRQWVNAIRRFVLWLDTHDFVGGVRAINVDHIYEYGQRERPQLESYVRTLLRSAVDIGGAGVSQEVRDELDSSGVSVLGKRDVPLRGYSAGECNRMAAACHREINAWREGTAFAMPSAGVAIAYRILLGLEHDLPAESWNTLRTTDLRWQGAKDVRIEYFKGRANGPQGRNFDGQARPVGAELLQQWLDESAVLRRAMGDEPRLWVYANPRGEGVVAKFSEMTRQRRTFLAKHNLRDDNANTLSLDLRRLRTTAQARADRYWNGGSLADPTHSAAVEGNSYLTASADLDVVDETIESAQHDRIRVALSVKVVVADESALANLVDAPGLIADRQVDGMHGWDMFATWCENPFDSPFSTKGKFCTATAWSCLVCPLALFTPDKLPALLQLERYLSRQSAEVSQQEWLRIYGPAWIRLKERILPTFTTRAIAAAQKQMESYPSVPAATWRDQTR